MAETVPSALTVFPDRLSPVFVKELRQGLRAQQFVWPFIAVQVFAIAAVGVEMGLVHLATAVGSTGISFFDGGFFFVIVGLVFSVLMPLTLFGALQPEVSDGRNIELLLLSNLTRWQIVLGKLIVGSALSALMMVSLLPYMLMRYFIGDVELVQNAVSVARLMMLNALMNAIVIGASGVRNYVGRVFLILFMLGSYSVTAAIGGLGDGELWMGGRDDRCGGHFAPLHGFEPATGTGQVASV